MTIGYDVDLLKTEFNEDRIRAAAAEELDLSITVANNREWQEALAKATTYGKKFMSRVASISPRTTCLLPQRWEIVRGKSLRWKKI